METEAKYYTPDVEELRVGFECETLVESFEDCWKKERIYAEFNINGWETNLEDILVGVEDGYLAVRVKYLDSEDIESLGFEKSLKNQWIGWNDYYSGNVSGEYGYFLYVTLHVPRLYNKSNKLEDNLFKIIVHRYYVSNEDETTNIEEKLEQNESEVIYKGVIKNKSELKQVLKMIGVH